LRDSSGDGSQVDCRFGRTIAFGLACLVAWSGCVGDSNHDHPLLDRYRTTADGGDGRSPDAGRQDTPLAGPEAILCRDGQVYVSNVNTGWDETAGEVSYQTGYVVKLALEDLSFLARGETPYFNPQFFFRAGARLGVVCSGTAAYQEDGNLVQQEPGGIALIDPDTLETVAQIDLEAGTPHALVGFPGTPAYHADTATLVVGSGTGPYLYRVNLEDHAVSLFTLEDSPEKNDLVVPIWLGSRLFASSFRQGLLFELDRESGALVGDPVDITSTSETEGPADMVVFNDRILVLHTISRKVVEVDPSNGEMKELFNTGSAPNQLVLAGKHLFVVNSMDNNLTRYDLDTGKSHSAFAVFPPQTNPWAMAVVEDQGLGLVTGYLANNVTRISLVTGETQ